MYLDDDFEEGREREKQSKEEKREKKLPKLNLKEEITLQYWKKNHWNKVTRR